MTQAVVIKSKSYGIHLVLDPKREFPELMKAVVEKFRDAEGFFKNAKMGVSFEGYALTVEQQYDLIAAIQEQAGVDILCIMEQDKIQEACVLEKTEAFIRERVLENATCHYGSLAPGEELHSDIGLVILGDLPLGAKAVAGGNIIVFGELKGFAQAGSKGDPAAYIAALSIDTEQMQIGNILSIPEEKGGKQKKGFFRKKKNAGVLTPQIARVQDGHVIMEPFTKDLL